MLKTWEFTVILKGTGHSEDEAWQEAVDVFVADPGEPDTAEVVEDVRCDHSESIPNANVKHGSSD